MYLAATSLSDEAVEATIEVGGGGGGGGGSETMLKLVMPMLEEQGRTVLQNIRDSYKWTREQLVEAKKKLEANEKEFDRINAEGARKDQLYQDAGLKLSNLVLGRKPCEGVGSIKSGKERTVEKKEPLSNPNK